MASFLFYNPDTGEVVYSMSEGSTGPTGPTGGSPVGVTGITGPTGGSMDGSAGPTGDRGITGPTGESFMGGCFSDYLYWSGSEWVPASQDTNSVFLGCTAGGDRTATDGVALGFFAGRTATSGSVCIGSFAGGNFIQGSEGGIVINASGQPLNGQGGRMFVNPVRKLDDTDSSTQYLQDLLSQNANMMAIVEDLQKRLDNL